MSYRLSPALFAGAICFGASCEPDAPVARILTEQLMPREVAQSRAARRAQLVEAARKLRASRPNDVWAHRAYVDAVAGEQNIGRSEAVEEYDALLSKTPRNAAVLYGAAPAKYGRQTAEAIKLLQAALTLQPDMGPAHALLAEIYASQSFRDKQKIRLHLESYGKACPESVELSQAYAWLDDPELQRWIAARARTVLGSAANVNPGEYLQLWLLETRSDRSDRQQAQRELIRADVERLRQPEVPRTTTWAAAMNFAAEQFGDRGIATAANEEMATRYPRSTYPGSVAANKWHTGNPWPGGNASETEIQQQNEKWHAGYKELTKAFPEHFALAYSHWRAAAANKRSTPDELSVAFDALKAALERDTFAMLTSPPVQCEVAQELLKRDFRIDEVPPLVRKCIEVTETLEGMGTESDLFPKATQAQNAFRDMWYLFAYVPLTDAYIRLKDKANAADILSQIETKLNRMRPSPDASSEDKFRHAEFEAKFWHMKGRYAELAGRKMDALVLYRNSLTTFPVRRPRADSREIVMADARRLWTEFGGTEQGWNEWAATSSLDKFHAGAGRENAWAKLAQVEPDLQLTDTAGRLWKPGDLAKRVTFVNMWATWCAPCREELPYVEKLRDQLKDRENIVVLAVNVDEETALVQPFLERLKLGLGVTRGREFAYDYFPTMAIPANWITGPEGTSLFHIESDKPEEWLKEAAAAVVKAANQ